VVESAPNGATNENSNTSAEQQAAPSVDPRISDLEAQVKEKENKYLYLYAEFENFKKRAVKERSDLIKFGWEPVARDLLQVVDNLERAIFHMPPATDKNLAAGLQMVVQQFKGTLEKQGVQRVDSTGKPFDPNFHEAVASEESDQPEGTIVKEQQGGYTLHGRLLRPAQVVVSAGRKSGS